MKVTPHLIAAGAVLLLALMATLPVLLGGVGSYPIEQESLTLAVPADDLTVVTAEDVLGPLVPGADGQLGRNPFDLKPIVLRPEFSIPPPPPPELELPDPPALPLVRRGGALP